METKLIEESNEKEDITVANSDEITNRKEKCEEMSKENEEDDGRDPEKAGLEIDENEKTNCGEILEGIVEENSIVNEPEDHISIVQQTEGTMNENRFSDSEIINNQIENNEMNSENPIQFIVETMNQEENTNVQLFEPSNEDENNTEDPISIKEREDDDKIITVEDPAVQSMNIIVDAKKMEETAEDQTKGKRLENEKSAETQILVENHNNREIVKMIRSILFELLDHFIIIFTRRIF
eukprot:TRINITY_DN2996_c0_g2_i18.p1 TRINITY_DN2996_c0_g2~~TRINITY_DN2996_c0_g2_i18.p1  ORF type:complete len:238 (-),score=75.98 TRINITY_DN2996_c0_g2_i18:272-985(-)